MALTTVEVTKQVFDLEAFDEIEIGKQIEFDSVESVDQALERLSSDSDRLVKIINQGLLEEAKREARKDENGWHTFTDEGKLNGEYSGIVANPKKVNIIVLGLAKSVFGFKKDMDPKDKTNNKKLKREAKEKALDFIKGNETIKEGLKVNAAFDDSDDENAVSEVESDE